MGLLSRFRNKHFLVLAGNTFTSVVGLVTGALLAHFLPLTENGIWWIIISFVTLCESARYGLLATATVKFYAGTEPARAKTVMGSVWVLAIALTIVILLINGALYLAFPHTGDVETDQCIKWVGITYLSTLPADVAFWRLQAEERYGAYFWYRMLNSVSTITSFIVLAAMHKLTLETALEWNFLTNCIASVTGMLLNMTGFRMLFHQTRECVTELFHYGKYTFLTTSFSVLIYQSDNWIINFLLTPADVAIYNVAMRLMPIIDLPLRSFVTTGTSEMAIQYNRHNMHQVGYIFKKYTGMLTIAFVPVILGSILLGNIFILLYGGHQYTGTIAPALFSMCMAISILYPFDRFNGVTLDITNHNRINSIKVAIMLIVKVLAAFAGIYLLKSVFGIVWAILISTVAGVIFGHYHLRKVITYSFREIFSLGYSETIVLIRKQLGKK
jgi:O-antigen/teichoic acid export membrane protein